MSQHDYVVANASGLGVRTDINDALAAIGSVNSGASAPSVTFGGMLWFNTTRLSMARRNNANTAWEYPFEGNGDDVASASTIDLDAVTGRFAQVTGTTGITTITLREGQTKTVRFTGILIITNGASLVNITGANITTAAGDVAVFQGFAAGVVRMIGYERISGAPLVMSSSDFSTGDVKLTYKTTADSGWLMMADQTIGSASSGATYANSLAEALFTLAYDNFTDTNSPILTSGGAGTTRAAQTDAATAWAANCRITLPKTLGRSIASAGAGSGLTSRALAAINVGAETDTPSTTKMASHPHGTSHISNDSGLATLNLSNPFAGGSSWGAAANTYSAGSGGVVPILDPTTYMNVMIKL